MKHSFARRVRLPAVLATFALVTLSISSTAKPEESLRVTIKMPTRGICAHRGASLTHPENTLPAFREAIRLGAQMIEFDVAMTRDNEIVLMHDKTVDRTTNGSGPVSEYTLAEIQQLDAGGFKGPEFKGTQVPTLGQTLQMMPDNIWLNVHLKGSTQLAVETAKVIHAAQRTHQCFLACGRKEIEAARSVVPTIKHCNMDRQANHLKYVEQTVNMNAEFIQLLGGNSADPKHIQVAKQNSVTVNYCCSNSAEVISSLFKSGVQFPLVDDVSGMMQVAIEQGIPKLEPRFR
jgi:glycerophosphoryl diester phosphodiesterase